MPLALVLVVAQLLVAPAVLLPVLVQVLDKCPSARGKRCATPWSPSR
jgi:hypothetical protein